MLEILHSSSRELRLLTGKSWIRSISLFLKHLRDWFADAAVGHLDMEEGGDGGGDVGHVDLVAGVAGVDAPAHENQGDMGVVGVPSAVGGAGLAAAFEPGGIG